METGFRGTFVIQWSQTELDGQWSGPLRDLVAGRSWCWTGEAVRVDGPADVLPLGAAQGQADLRRRVGQSLRRLLSSVDAAQVDPRRFETAQPAKTPVTQTPFQGPLFKSYFSVTDGFRKWDITLVGTDAGRNPLLMCQDTFPPRNTELWVVDAKISRLIRKAPQTTPGGVICFTPGTMIATPDGVRDVACLREGDRVQTKDNGTAEILWLGTKHISGARLHVMPDLRPVRLRAGALDRDVPDAGLVVSPDHRIVLRGPRARALFNADEVLVTARDLINDQSIMRDNRKTRLTYIHMMLPQHEIVFANGVATESFHPASAALTSMAADEKDRLFDRLPDIAGDPHAYGAFARPLLSNSDAAILQHDAGRRLSRKMDDSKL